MKLVEAAGQTLVVGFEGTAAPPQVRDALKDRHLGGVVLFKRNIDSPAQAHALLCDLSDGSDPSLPPLLCVDQEGGRVQRLQTPFMELPPMRVLGSVDDVLLTRDVGVALGRQLRAVGFNLDFAPVLDVDSNPDNPIIGDRAFSSEPQTVIRHALALSDGLISSGVLSCGKHFPGHGDTDADSHLALPTLKHPRSRLDEVELLPFAKTIHQIPSMMTAHVVFEALERDVPATLSHRVVTDLLKNELGYQGAVFSDDLEMNAVSKRWGVVDAGVLAIAAGCDLLLVCSKLKLAFELREALIREAEKSKPFAERLSNAAQRAHHLRSQIPPSAAGPLGDALGHPDDIALMKRIESHNNIRTV